MRIFKIMFLCLLTNLCFAQSQSEMNMEARADYQKVDKGLNSTYKKILQEYKPDTAFIKNLKAAQNIWIKFRDAELKMKYPDRAPGYYGSIQPVCFYNYLEELTKKRDQDLRIWLTGIEEGDACSGSVKMK
ncbi:MAG: hypothetical protein ACI9V1_001211 [Spirosomataceae bacterium]|jgi:uncharacterized protein YecT (DUF1311 family)